MKPSKTPILNTTLTLAVALALSACQSFMPINTKPDTHLPEAYDHLVLDNAQADMVLTKDWWKLYQDNTLNQLEETALSQNLDIQKAVARIEEADAYANEVGAALLPQVNLDAGSNKNRVTEAGAFPAFGQNPRNTFNVRLGTQYEIDFWGKVRGAKASARAQLLASEYAKDVVALTVASNVALQYVQIRLIDSQLAIAQQTQQNREESLALTKRRLAGGIVSALDVHQAELALSNLTAQIIELKRLRQLALHQLHVLTGDLRLNINQASLEPIPVPPVPPVGVPSRLLEARPDIAQAEQALMAANANIGIAKAALFPSISLTANYGGESLALGDVLKSASRIWTAGIGLNLPIFDAGRLKAKVSQANAQQKQSLIAYQQAIQKGFVEVNDGLVNMRQFTEKEQALQRSSLLAKQALAIAENRYHAGYSSYLEVLDAQRNYLDAQTSHLQTRANRMEASVDLFKALGGGWQAYKP